MKRKVFLLALSVLVLLSVAPAKAQDDFYVVVVGGGVGTPITSVPKTITKEGFYYLKGNLTYTGSGTAINIDHDNVTLDLMGFCLSGNGGGQGVYSANKKNVEVRNGTVRNFSYGIKFSSGTGYRILKMTTCDNSDRGINCLDGIATINGCQSYNNTNYGYVITSNGIFTNNVATGNNNGFHMFNGSGQLLDRNSSVDNTTSNWVRTTGCTMGLNTP